MFGKDDYKKIPNGAPGIETLLILLHSEGVVKGRKLTAYPAVGPDITAAGGDYVAIPVDQAYVDGNLVSAPAWPAHPEWIAKFMNVLGAKIEL
jgi:protease I